MQNAEMGDVMRDACNVRGCKGLRTSYPNPSLPLLPLVVKPIQVSVLTIDTTATPPAPAEPFGVAEWKWLMVES